MISLERKPIVRTGHLALALLFIPGLLGATQPPARDNTGQVATPPAAWKRYSQFTYKRALRPLTRAIQLNRSRALLSQSLDFSLDSEANAFLGPTAITGEKRVPVLPVNFLQEPNPFPPAKLELELFSEEWPEGCNATQTCTGTMRQFYREMSYGQFTVTGTVFPWTTLNRSSSYYEGADYVDEFGVTQHCKGFCSTANVPSFIRESLQANSTIRWEDYDNDGPDGLANSGDDDGYVDFVAFVHSKSGGECSGSTGIWSHRYSLSSATGSDFETTRVGLNGSRIRIDDYVVMPSFDCDSTTMIQIGVFAHEFGHAFGLPDLYDTSDASSGLGNWCLMAGGSWGGDGDSPERPSHMSAWAKEFLGWISVQTIMSSGKFDIPSYESSPSVLRVPISPAQYYLISNLRKDGFDSRFPAEGLAVWKVNQTAVNAGLFDNTVNTPAKRGVQLVQADGLEHLEKRSNRGDAGDLFPTSLSIRSLEGTTTPSSLGNLALCEIGDPMSPMAVAVLVGASRCQQQTKAPPLHVDPAAQ